MSQSKWIGKSLSKRYKLDEMLGQGGMSSVYKATDPNLKRVVAIKMIHPHLSSDPNFVRRFEEEAAAVAQLRHPNIIQVYDFNHDDDIYYMVLEFVPGETVQQHLKRLNESGRLLSITKAMEYVADICDAVDYAHQRGMIHRDIKPANLMLNVMGQAILMDFGIAKMVGGQRHTATGAVVGTAMYMSPEQIKGEHPDRQSDIYSLGVTLFEMIGGRPPFEADSAMTLMMMHVNDPVPDPRNLNPEVPADLVAVINKALAKNPNDRYQTAAQMGAALRNVIGRIKSGASLEAPGPGATMIEEALPSQPSPSATYVEPSSTPASKPDATYVEPASSPKPKPEATSIETPPPPTSKSGGTLVESKPRPAVPPAKASRPATSASSKSMTRILGFSIPIVLGGVFILAVLGIGGIFLLSRIFGGGGAGVPTATITVAPIAVIVDTPQPTASVAPVATSLPSETPTPSDTPTPSLTPTATVPPGIPYVRINSIIIDEQNRYVVEYETFEYTEVLPGMHVHFFFNTVTPENAGYPGSGPWILYGGPRPFTGYRVSDRPAAATQMCALVANSNHSIQLNSGNCFDLP